MDEQQRKAMLKETFDTVSSGYDNRALRFFSESAGPLAAGLGIALIFGTRFPGP